MAADRIAERASCGVHCLYLRFHPEWNVVLLAIQLPLSLIESFIRKLKLENLS